MAQQSIRNVPDPPERQRRKTRRPDPPRPPTVQEMRAELEKGQVPPPPPQAPEITHPLRAPEGLAAHEAARLRNLLAERALRRLDALRLYAPLPVQTDFHLSESRINLLRGSNRGGKTLPAAVEVARAVCGMDPHKKYPLEDGRCFAVGKDLKHIGEVMWRKLSYPGAFKIIRDGSTGVWRSYRPWDQGDLLREHEARPAPPLIAPRFIKDIAWENKKEDIPTKVKFTTGWELSFFSSLGKPPQGSDLDLAWFDEEIVDPNWFPEMVARLLDRQGRLMWSATPQAGTEVLYDLSERAARERWATVPQVAEHIILLADNPHIREEDKRALAANLTEEERRVRIDGDFALVSFRVYPEFNMLVHGVELEAGLIPAHWARYVVIDPGHRLCGVLFAAVPPPEQDDAVYLYDELYLRECDARKFAINLESRARGQRIQACLIDPNMAVHTELGIGKTVGQQYSEALEQEGFYAEATGTGFILGCDDTEAGILAVHGWLRVGDSGQPKLRVLKGRCPSLEDEFKRYVKKRVAGQIVDQPNNRRHNHLMDCLRYLALYNPRYVVPREAARRTSPIMKAFRAKQDRKRAQEGRFVNLGPGRNFSHA